MKIYQVDAFTNKPFHGNPAAVCLLSGQKPASWMQHLAEEMNLSETAFVLKDNKEFNLRWFTPKNEEDLCGHATLASAHVLWETGNLPQEQEARFNTRSGRLTARKKGDWIEMNFPAEPPEKVAAPENLLKALEGEPLYVGKNRLDYILEIESEEKLLGLRPKMEFLDQLDTRGIIVTAQPQSEKYDFVSRFFAPGSGIPEDPVTGSAHCCLVPYWAKKLDKQSFKAFQASSRGGELKLTLDDERVLLEGQAVTVFEGELKV
jgi:PhzF family phenazine biosynthesis protein